MRIGDLALRTGTTAPTIRYYEQIGLLRRPPRSGGRQRTYDREDVRNLTFIRRCREFDFSIEEIRALLALLRGDSSCSEARKLAEERAAELRRRIAELSVLETSIASLIELCARTCDGAPASDCAMLCLAQSSEA